MIIISFQRPTKKYALQIVTIGSSMLLKTIYFNHVKSGDRRIRKFIKELSNTTKYGYTIYINPTDIYDYKRLKEDIKKSENLYISNVKQLSPQTLAEISITSKAQYAMFSRSLFFLLSLKV